MSYQCPCCGFYTFQSPPDGSYEICPVCFWEDDPVQAEDQGRTGGANHVSLQKARLNFARFGACEEAVRPYVREPREDERTGSHPAPA